ncbi:MAG TPA: ATP12 family protein [Rhizomicrobium sp.]|nr:ATP12 family protein [Rhizomicrobium sp.]
MKRFYKSVSVRQQGGHFAVMLDGRPVKTPGGEIMALRTPAPAEAVAAEWARQGTEIDLDAMRFTRLAYAAIDGAPRTAEIVTDVLKFGRSDLTCYRADAPPELVARQAQAWDVPLLWVRTRYGAALRAVTGMTFVEQPPEAIVALEQALVRRDVFALAPLHAATAILGSLVLALNLADGRLDAASAFAAAHVDEAFQAEKWGTDPEAKKRLDRLAADLASAEQFLRLL